MNIKKITFIALITINSTIYAQIKDSVKTKELEEAYIQNAKYKWYLDILSTSGTRLPLRLVETPQTIQVIPNQILKDQQTQNLNDVTKNMTGVISNNMYTSYTMRGFTNSYYNQFLTFDGFVGNMYQWTQMVQLYNIDRVEMIAGPASALYSTGSPGGVINMVTKKPQQERMYSFNVVTGSWGLIDVSTDLTGSLTKNKKLRYRLNAGYNYANSFRPDQFNKNIVIAPSIAYHLSDKTNITIDYVFAENDSRFGQDHGGLVLMNKDSTYNWKGLDNKFQFGSPKSYSQIQNNNLTLRFNHKFNEHFAVTYMSRGIWSKVNSGEIYGNYWGDNYLTKLPDSMQRAYNTWYEKPYNFQNSVFTTIKFGNETFKNNLVVGADYQIYGETYNRYISGNANTVSFLNPNYANDNYNFPRDSTTNIWDVKEKTTQIGGYIQYLTTFKNKITVLLAGRYENFIYLRAPNSKDTQTSADTSNAKVFLPRAGLVYNITKNQSVYGSYCESFMPQYDNSRSTGGPYPPQKGKQFEIGYKGLFFGGKLMASSALYAINFVNILQNDPNDPNHIKQIVVPGLTSKGAEFTLQGNINQFSIIGGYVYNSVVFSTNSPLGPKGGRYDNAPKNVANIWIKYSIPDKTKMKGLSLALGGKFVGDRVGYASNQHFVLPSYYLLDASINYAYKQFVFGLNCYNITNTVYASGYYSSDFMVQVGTPANFKLSVRYTIQ